LSRKFPHNLHCLFKLQPHSYYAFNVNSASSNRISFNHNGVDNIGIMLDNLNLSSVDELGTIALLGLGLLGLGPARRKQ
jgi:hypothetical protein